MSFTQEKKTNVVVDPNAVKKLEKELEYKNYIWVLIPISLLIIFIDL
mgnify:CR=1 FL=1